MALNKKITLDNGIITNYHRIKSVSVNYVENETVICVENYVSKEIRDNLDKIKELEQSIVQLSNSMDEAERTRNEELFNTLADKLYEVNHEYVHMNNKQFSAHTDNILIDSIPDDISLANIYTLLKTTEKYAKAKKV